MTLPEQLFWSRVRSRQIGFLKFRRQHGIGPYIVDFYCPSKLVVIEIDGDTHAEENQHILDLKREKFLKGLGLTIIRYDNLEILRNLNGVLEDLCKKLNINLTSPTPP